MKDGGEGEGRPPDRCAQTQGPERARAEGRGLHRGHRSSCGRAPSLAKPPTPGPIWAPKAGREEEPGNNKRPKGSGEGLAAPGERAPCWAADCLLSASPPRPEPGRRPARSPGVNSFSLLAPSVRKEQLAPPARAGERVFQGGSLGGGEEGEAGSRGCTEKH